MHCTICREPIGVDAARYACTSCERALRQRLRTIVAELPLLRAAMVPGSPSGGRRPVGRAHSPLPVNVRVLDLLGPGATNLFAEDPYGEQTGGIAIGPLLTGWVRWIGEQQLAAYRLRHGEDATPPRGTPPRTGGIAGLCARLGRQVPYAATRPWVADLDADLADAVRRVRAITGSRPARHIRLAPCPECSAFALVQTDGQWGVRCEACEHRMDPDAYAAHASAVLPSLTAIAVRMVGAELSQGAA
jgi:hypothetical protein